VHAIRRRYDLDQLKRGIGHEEAKGLGDKEVKELLAESRLRLAETIPFVSGLNRLYIGEKERTGDNLPSRYFGCGAQWHREPHRSARGGPSHPYSPRNCAKAVPYGIEFISSDGAQGLWALIFR
jgi:hypothetical protein